MPTLTIVNPGVLTEAGAMLSAAVGAEVSAVAVDHVVVAAVIR
jgi:hypothetical protein